MEGALMDSVTTGSTTVGHEQRIERPIDPLKAPVNRGPENELTAIVNEALAAPWGVEEQQRYIEVPRSFDVAIVQEVAGSFHAAGWTIYDHTWPRRDVMVINSGESLYIDKEKAHGFVVERPRWHQPALMDRFDQEIRADKIRREGVRP
jgi:hypothetical protein